MTAISEKPRRGKRWRYKLNGSEVRILAEAEGWVMVRYKGAAPFLLTVKELHAKYDAVTAEAKFDRERGSVTP